MPIKVGQLARGAGRVASRARPGSRFGSSGRRHRHGAAWYYSQIRRLRAKRAYERIKYGGRH